MLVESGVGGKVGYVSNVVVSQSFKLAECECFNVSRKSWCGKTFSSSFVFESGMAFPSQYFKVGNAGI